MLVIKQLEAFGVGNSEVFSELRSRHYVEMDVFKLLLVSLAGWMNRQQQEVIDYLQEEVRVLKEMAEKRGGKRLRFTDEQRARLARKANSIWSLERNRKSGDSANFARLAQEADSHER